MFTDMDESSIFTDEAAAIRWLLTAVGETASGDRDADLELAALATLRIRELNSIAGGMVFNGWHARWKSWRKVAMRLAQLGHTVSVKTLRRWSDPPST
jgi:hypothetical protein